MSLEGFSPYDPGGLLGLGTAYCTRSELQLASSGSERKQEVRGRVGSERDQEVRRNRK